MTTSRSSLPWLLLAPAGLLILAIIYLPLVYSTLISLTDAHLLRFSSAEFIGFGNYERLLARHRLATSLWRTLTYSAGTVVLSFLTGLFVALLLNRTTVLRGLTRTLLIIPWATPWLVVTLIWYVMFNPQLGPINEVLNLLGVLKEGHSWLYSSETAMLSIVIATSWRLFPAVTLILLAGLQGIPPEQYEAAEVDGASAWARFRYITMPGIRTVSITMLTLLTIWSSKLFTMAWTLTRGGPGDATRVLSVYTYQEAFGSNRLGRGSALAVISLLFSLLLVFVYLVVLRREEEKTQG